MSVLGCVLESVLLSTNMSKEVSTSTCHWCLYFSVVYQTLVAFVL